MFEKFSCEILPKLSSCRNTKYNMEWTVNNSTITPGFIYFILIIYDVIKIFIMQIYRRPELQKLRHLHIYWKYELLRNCTKTLDVLYEILVQQAIYLKNKNQIISSRTRTLLNLISTTKLQSHCEQQEKQFYK